MQTEQSTQSALNPKVWIIILNWNGLDDTLACLESLEKVESNAKIEILVIDNGSQQDPRAAIARRFPTVRVERLASNHGFAGGCNIGISLAVEAQADYLLLLNNDTTVSATFLEPLLAHLQSHPTTAIVLPLICYADEPKKVWFAGAKINLALGYFEHRYQNRLRSSVPITPFKSDYATGCCMLMASTLIQKIGAFDERLFAYYEDVDFSLRTRQAGFEIMCQPKSVILHQVSASTRRNLTQGNTSPFKHYLMIRNGITIIKKHASTWQKIAFFLFSNVITFLYYILGFTIRRRWQKMSLFCQGTLHGLQGRFEDPELIGKR